MRCITHRHYPYPSYLVEQLRDGVSYCNLEILRGDSAGAFRKIEVEQPASGGKMLPITQFLTWAPGVNSLPEVAIVHTRAEHLC